MIRGLEVKRDHDIDQFTFYWSFKDAIRELTDTDKLQVYEAITDFAFFGKEPGEMSAFSKLCWKLIRPHLERSRSHGGRSQGAPIGNKNAAKNNQKTIKKQSTQNNSLEIEKEKEIEKNNIGVIGGTPSPMPQSISDEEKKFMEWMRTDYPHVAKMEQPLTLQQFRQLKEGRSTEVVTAILIEMDNYKPLTRKNRSAYRTALNWLQRKEDRK